ncbi:exosortase family protein XrtF [Neotamlana laminarinivorans]|uniref:Exosortase family protein XrtF n=1 Tax=Neotamlana laminarinivorans TaxID=2883124 RepID=A0A9X1I3U3_9FLAO|nr:exosortase family protein XrtF [Tamlana laminarinivorans]MCB4799912.1 exosortase family protein XrtF [Tamlana laminarinivorans]
MKALFVKYKGVIKFILVFLVVYAALTFMYKFYLQFSSGNKFYPDYITHTLAKQTELVLTDLGYNARVEAHANEPSMKLILNGNFLARIIEGCNAVSVIILFISFVIAFSGTLKNTLFFIIFGSVIIYVVNLLRIVILSIGLYKYPQHSHVLHSVIFPAIIYGILFLLWIFWVNRFSKLKNNE